MKQVIAVLSALGLVLLLAVSLVARVSARAADKPPQASLPRITVQQGTVPLPRPIVLTELPTPFCWGCSWNSNAPLEFQLDLDLLAPLGEGAENVAPWFAQFAKENAGDAFNLHRERQRSVTIDGQEWTVLPGDDPLLLEAEPWVDQATLSFYPDVWQVRGIETAIPNLLMMLDLARAWIVRGKLAGDTEAAQGDFRRAIRLGRLMRQDDVTLIQDLVAIACIRLGAEAMYEQARQEGDAATMLVASLVLADKDAMRQMTAQRITSLERAFRVQDPEAATLELRLSDAELDAMIELIGAVQERRFRMDGLIGMHAVRHLGTPAQRERAQAVLDQYSEDPDRLTADMARHYRDAELDIEELREMLRAGE